MQSNVGAVCNLFALSDGHQGNLGGYFYAAGVYTFAHLARLTPAQIKAIVAPGSTGNFIDAEAWIAQAQTLAANK